MDKLDIDFSFIDDQEDAECVIYNDNYKQLLYLTIGYGDGVLIDRNAVLKMVENFYMLDKKVKDDRSRHIEKLEKESIQNKAEWQAKSIKNRLFQSEISEMVSTVIEQVEVI